MLRAIVVLLLVAGVTALAAPVPKTLKAKTFDLTGKWVTAERVNNGQVVTDPWVWQISGETLTPCYLNPDDTLRPTYPSTAVMTFSRPDPAKPDEFDYQFNDAGSRYHYRGRVAWEGDEWVFCFGQPGADRPAEVKAGKDVTYYRFKRLADK
jgi:hypothetical protein